MITSAECVERIVVHVSGVVGISLSLIHANIEKD